MSCGARLAPFDIAELRDVTAYDELELDTLGFLSVENLQKIAPDCICSFCDGCFTGKYPIPMEDSGED